MELGSYRHGVDHNRLLVWIVIEDHDLQESPGRVRTDEEIPSFAWYHPDGMAEGVVDVLVRDAVFSGAVCDLHVETRLPCP
jgi:hypothetical protein